MSFTFTDQELEKWVHLCRIACTEEEQENLKKNLSRVLNYVALLQEVDTEGIPPCNHVMETVHNVWREDVIGETLSREAYLSNTTHAGGVLRVPPVINFSTP